ncbi:MAG: hypothetical protein MPK06_07895 [Alphaproteobacteria bacterium]|nr:hypothetical protein [Alphaproteobacteria bacterium]MDA8003859.1 hypothetical protein [Alphaproteobacteria bacterium]MDA8006433.1 hypothetical protein [Alphaproteobacteria bacterium]MDA8013832.1 hypothetical protein [Alphaproteobacteria bacterium]
MISRASDLSASTTPPRQRPFCVRNSAATLPRPRHDLAATITPPRQRPFRDSDLSVSAPPPRQRSRRNSAVTF